MVRYPGYHPTPFLGDVRCMILRPDEYSDDSEYEDDDEVLCHSWYAATMLCRVCCYVLPGPDGGMLLCVGRYVLSGINKGMLLRVGRYVDRVARRRKPARVHDERKLRAGDRPIKGVFVRMVPGISVLAFDFAVCYGLRLCSAMSSTSVGHAAT
eukprot:2478960-Rhodomonas_salina.2